MSRHTAFFSYGPLAACAVFTLICLVSPGTLRCRENDGIRSREAFFLREDLPSELLELRELLLPSPEYRVKWYPSTGLLTSPRRVGFVNDRAYCDRSVPLLRRYLEYPDSNVRLWVAQRLAELGCPDGFPILLDALDRELDQAVRGGDGYLFVQPGIADRVVALVGSPETYDPAGTRALREYVVNRWRNQWQADGVSFLSGLQKRARLSGKQTLDFYGITESRHMEDMQELFFLGGRRLFEIGAMDGSHPPVGRLLGDQSGVWALPFKLIDGFRFTVLETGEMPWHLVDCRDFTHDFASCTFNFTRSGLMVTRTDYPAQHEPVLYSRLDIRNETGRKRTLRLRFTGRVNIRPAWQAHLANGLDCIEYRHGLVQAVDRDMPGCPGVVFGTEQQPSDVRLEDNTASLTYSLKLEPGSETGLTFVIALSRPNGDSIPTVVIDEDRAVTLPACVNGMIPTIGDHLERAVQRLVERRRWYRRNILGGVRFRCSDQAVTRAFLCAKANVLMSVVDFSPYFDEPLLIAGVPDYVQLFGCDTFYSVAGAVAAGFVKAARGSMVALADCTRRQNGRVPHEAGCTGGIISPGNVQETPQFVMACADYVRWTGDGEFLKTVYPLCCKSVENVLRSADRDGDGYLEGYGIMEVEGMCRENIDGACYLYGAYLSLSEMAGYLGFADDIRRYTRAAGELKARFNADWWNAEEQMWADALEGDGTRHMAGYWGVDIPMETGIADSVKAVAALKKIRKNWVNKWHLGGAPVSFFSTCPFSNNVLALGAFNYGDTALGWERLRLTARLPLELGTLGAMENAYPVVDDILQLWSCAPYLEAVIGGLAGVVPRAPFNRVELFPQPPGDLEFFQLRDLSFGVHTIDLSWRRDGGEDLYTVGNTSKTGSVHVLFRFKTDGKRSVAVDGRTVRPKTETVRGIPTGVLKLDLSAGTSTRIRLE